MTTPAFAAPERPDVARRVGDPRLPLTAAQVCRLRARLTPREIERAEPDVDFLAIMGDPKRRTDPAIFDAAVGSLGVLGYGRPWLARKLGLPEAALAPRQRRILPYRMRLVLTAAIRIGSRWATPKSTGQTAEQIDEVQGQALALGFRVPAAYSNLYVPETATTALPEEIVVPRAEGPEAIAAAKVRMLAYFCEYGGRLRDLARRFGLTVDMVGRSRTDVGLRCVMNDRQASVGPGQDDLIVEIIAAANAVSAGADAPEVYRRLRAYGTERAERLAAQEGAHEAPVAA